MKSSSIKSKAGFTMVEMLTVLAIIVTLSTLGVAAVSNISFKSTHGATTDAYELFSQARTEAIMRQTPCAVIVDTANKTDTTHYLRRMAVAYQSGTSSGHPVWSQSSPWMVLPAGTYFDLNWSTLNGSGQITFNGSGTATGYSVFAFSPNGQAYNPYGATALSQLVISAGNVDSVGNFTERGPFVGTTNASTANSSQISTTSYGFVVFPMGRLAFIQDMVHDPQTPVNTFTP